MIQPSRLHAALTAAAHEVNTLGPLTWQRVDDWTRPERLSTDSSRGGGLGSGRSDGAIEHARLDAQASAYKDELDQLTKRLESDLHRLRRIIAIANPDTPRSEDVGCRSCFRDEGNYEPVHAGRYRHACRFCGEWKAANGDWPPLAVVRWRRKHPGKKVPLHVVDQAS